MGEGDAGSAGQFILPMVLALVPIIGFVVVILVVRMFMSPARKARKIDEETVAAIRENNALLRELIALNRQILDKQEHP